MTDEGSSAGDGGFVTTVSSMRWMSLVIVYAGMLMVNQCVAQVALGRFGADGFESYLSNLEQNAHIDGTTRSVLEFLGDNGSVFAPLLAVFVAVTGLACMLLLARPIVALVVSVFFWILWYITSGISGIWTFEYLFPAAFTLVAGLATLPHFAGSAGSSRWLGGRCPRAPRRMDPDRHLDRRRRAARLVLLDGGVGRAGRLDTGVDRLRDRARDPADRDGAHGRTTP